MTASRAHQHHFSIFLFCLALVSSALSLSPTSSAEEAPPVARGATTGYELALHGVATGELGEEVSLHGVAYTVGGLAKLTATKGLVVDATVTARKRQGKGREVVTRGKATTRAGGLFTIDVPLAKRALAAPRLELTIHRTGQPGRTFELGLNATPPHQLDLLTDRERYEPGETLRVWVRATAIRGNTPVASSALRLRLFDGEGNEAADRILSTSISGVATVDIPLPETAQDGLWRVSATVAEGGLANSAERRITVTQRTVERIQATLELAQELVRPGEMLSGRVVVRTPSGSPIRRARVELHHAQGDPLILETNADGIAPFETSAPAFLSGDVAAAELEARVVHPAHGTIRASTAYTVSRVRWMVETTPGAGGVVPEVASELFISVSDPRGRPIKAGTKVLVRNVGLQGGQTEVSTDARGLALVALELPRGAAARRQSGSCQGRVATTVEVEVLSERPVTARLCVPVADKALVVPRAVQPLVSPGAAVSVEIRRRPEVRDRPVLVEAIWSNRAVAWAFASPRQAEVTLQLPQRLQGVVELRARPLWPSDRERPLDEPGATALGVGASTAILVRPSDAFSLTVAPEQELYRVREQASVGLRASHPPVQGWAALLVRDEAAHGGEGAWDLDWIRQELQEAVSGERTADNDLFLRLSLSALVSPDSPQAEPPPLFTPPWARSPSTGSYQPNHARSMGVLRDPVARREELIRRGLAPVMNALERAVGAVHSSDRSRDGIVRSAGGRRLSFHPQVIENLVASRQLSATQARTLGGETLTVAMVTAADRSFTFDVVATRVARAQLVRLLAGLASLANPDDPAAARASSNEPPERWLSVMVQLGMIEMGALVDPWGRPFSFRPVTGRAPAVVISERALRYELASPGPDGVLGTADDVRDPFERAVSRGTPYAIASGEDALMVRLSRLATGTRVLSAMVRAYDRLGLAATEERRSGAVDATTSEDLSTIALDRGPPEAEPATTEHMRRDTQPSSGIMLREGRRSSRQRAEFDHRPTAGESAAAEQPMEGSPVTTPTPVPAAAFQVSTSRGQAMGEMVRERFPATLFFVGEVGLDQQGQAEVEFPLADALTTYRLEAIAWSASGWTTSSMSRFSVDQEAMVDAPVPPYATVGDHIRLPVRVANRTDAALPVTIEVETEGDLSLSQLEATTIDVPPREAVEAIIDVRAGTVGEGAILIRAVTGGRTLDAVRRPLEVLENVRLAREVREELLIAGQTLRIEVPAEARPRGPGQLRIAVGSGIFGDPAHWGVGAGYGAAQWAGWVFAITGREVPESVIAEFLPWLPAEEDEWHIEPLEIALTLASLWDDERLSDALAREGLRAISPLLPTEGGVGADTEYMDAEGDAIFEILLALAPILEGSNQRPALEGDLERLEERLRRFVSSHAASAEEAPDIWASAAAALALIDRTSENRRAHEMIRRASRHVIEVGQEAWLEPPTTDGTMLQRIEPTALLAIAQLSLGHDWPSSLMLLRSLTRSAHTADGWPNRARAIASAAASMLARAPSSDQTPTIRLDGQQVTVQNEQGVITALLEDIGQPGTHRLDVDLQPGEVALAWLELRYGLPWSVVPDREAQIEVEWTGETGARDGRAGFRLELSNRGARIMTRPVVEVELPAGTELDEPTREALDALLAEPASTEGRTLQLRLRPLAPGGYVRLPLPLRWSISGTVIGLGTSVWDDQGPTELSARYIRVVPSRGVEIADRGEEPEQPEAEASPPPLRPCLPPIEPLAPIAEVLR